MKIVYYFFLITISPLIFSMESQNNNEKQIDPATILNQAYQSMMSDFQEKKNEFWKVLIPVVVLDSIEWTNTINDESNKWVVGFIIKKNDIYKRAYFKGAIFDQAKTLYCSSMPEGDYDKKGIEAYLSENDEIIGLRLEYTKKQPKSCIIS